MQQHRTLALRTAAALSAAGLVTLTACASTISASGPATASSGPSSDGTAAASASASQWAEQQHRPKLDDLKGDTDNAIAFAPLDHPQDVTVLGHVDNQSAWSTSKVLVMAAFLDTVADGDPANLSADQRSLIKRALTASDMDALLAVRAQIPGGSGAPMTRIARSIGDDSTSAPDIKEGAMQWSIRDQVRFMAALHDGKVVSPKVSAYLLDTMHPIAAHSWGLGTIGASAFKGGWLTPSTDTRQMGIVGDYAVAIITDGVGPAVVQSDGDSAHVQQMNKLARILKAHLDAQGG
jgi:hypothetical protein